MKRTTLLVGALAALAAGCSLVNAPDRSLIADGGMDSRVDGDARPDGDAGLDGDTMLDASDDACPSRNETCGNGVDDDCNGFVDCADPFCASRVACCMGGMTDTFDWSPSELLNNWNSLPDGTANEPELGGGPAGMETEIAGFTNVQGVITKACVPLATGYQIRWFFRMDEETCSGAPDCYASLVLTPATTIGPGRRLPNDLAVTAHGDGRITVTNATNLLGEATFPEGVDPAVNFIVDITVGDDAGTPSLLATVRLQSGGMTLVDAEPIAPLDALMRVNGCEEVGGLHLAIEGAGRQFDVGPLDRGPRECINASVFDVPDMGGDILSATPESLGWGAWASGGIGSPSIATGNDMGTDAWMVVGDGTDVDRLLDGAGAELGFAIGFSRVTANRWNDRWDVARTIDDPKVGLCNPSCATVPGTMGCTDCTTLEVSYRDPSFEQLSVELGDLEDATVTYARRVEPDAYGIAFDNLFPVDDPSNPGARMAKLMPGEGDFTDCMSLRDPMLVRRSREDPTDGYWLFFSCFTALDNAEIHAIQINSGFDPVAGTHKVVVPRTTEDWAASSVWSPEVIVEHEPGTGVEGRHLFRMWFLARNRANDTVSIGLVQAQLSADTPPNTLPDFEPFGANPILSEGDMSLGCGPFCRLRGLSVVRVPGTPTLRFLIAREDDLNPIATWHYAPFEQRWRSPWDPML